MLVTVLLLGIVLMSGCAPDVEEGELYYDSESYGLAGITALGKQSETIYVPSQVRGHSVNSIQKKRYVSNDVDFSSNKLKKIYFSFSIRWSALINWSCPNLEEAYLPNTSFKDYDYFISVDMLTYVPKVRFVDYLKGSLDPLEKVKHSLLPANIAYFFNYEDNPNDGYYFIDNIQETGKLIKPFYKPEREGYLFIGWYKEAECITAWNFDADTVKVRYEGDQMIYEETRLYAKWYKRR